MSDLLKIYPESMAKPGEGSLAEWKSVIAPSVQYDPDNGNYVSTFRATPTLNQGVEGEYKSSALLGRSKNGVDNWKIYPKPLAVGDSPYIAGLGDEDIGLHLIPEGSLPEEFDEFAWVMTSNTARLVGDSDPEVRNAAILANREFTKFRRYDCVIESPDPAKWRTKGLFLNSRVKKGGNLGLGFTLGSELPNSRIVYTEEFTFADLLGIGPNPITQERVARMFVENALVIPPAGSHRGVESGSQVQYIDFEGETFPLQIITGEDMQPYARRSWMPGVVLMDPHDQSRVTHKISHLMQPRRIRPRTKHTVVKDVRFAKSTFMPDEDDLFVACSYEDYEPRLLRGSVKAIMRELLHTKNGKEVNAYSPPKPY